MNFNEIDIEKEINNVTDAIEKKAYRPATKRESMAVRLAALSEIVHEMQILIKKDKELVNA